MFRNIPECSIFLVLSTARKFPACTVVPVLAFPSSYLKVPIDSTRSLVMREIFILAHSSHKGNLGNKAGIE